MKEIRLVICVPSTNSWEAQFGMSLVFLTNYLASHGVVEGKECSFMVHNKRGSILANMRQNMVEEALKNHATHLLFIDSDQTFPRDTFHRLMRHKKQVVAANIATKMIPSSPTARVPGNGSLGIPVETTLESPELQEVWRVGTGIMLIDLNVFKREGLKTGPWFTQRWNEETGAYVGEDWAFCEELSNAGVHLYVDHKLSLEVGHLGTLNYGHDLVVVDAVPNEDVA